MFKRLKDLFKSKEKQSLNKFSSTEEITFKDLALQNISVKIVPDGNNTALCITESINNYKIVLDKEKALLLGVILNTYSQKESFIDILEIFNNSENGE